MHFITYFKICNLVKLVIVTDIVGALHHFAKLCINTRCNDKPGFVVDSYLSRRSVANTLKRSMCADLTAYETYTIYFLLRTGFT